MVVSIRKDYGSKLARLVDSHIHVSMNITLENLHVYNVLGDITAIPHTHKSNTMVGISLCLVAVLLVGIIILLIYIVRRARYINARNSPHMVGTIYVQTVILFFTSS